MTANTNRTCGRSGRSEDTIMNGVTCTDADARIPARNKNRSSLQTELQKLQALSFKVGRWQIELRKVPRERDDISWFVYSALKGLIEAKFAAILTKRSKRLESAQQQCRLPGLQGSADRILGYSQFRWRLSTCSKSHR